MIMSNDHFNCISDEYIAHAFSRAIDEDRLEVVEVIINNRRFEEISDEFLKIAFEHAKNHSSARIKQVMMERVSSR